ncbi:MAG TPA: hypothetical protein VK890_11600, partial [Bacteroidia bacterium]|nr:hypothetical protein [Bacteroidia bacterium]
MKKLSLVFIAILSLPLVSKEQIQTVLPVATAENGALTSTVIDWNTIGINPSNLGWSTNHNLSFTFLNIGASGQSQGMNIATFMNANTSPDIVSSSNSWQNILGVTHGMSAYGDVNWAAASWRIPKFPGAFAVNIRDRVFANGELGPNAVNALSNFNNRDFNDATILTLLDGTSLNYYHYREINLAFGSPLLNLKAGSSDDDPDLAKCFSFGSKGGANGNNVELFGGLGFKYLIGLANVTAQVANSGINANYVMSNNYPNIPQGLFSGPGQGFAFDLGLSCIY